MALDSADWWLALLLAIPLSIVANLLTPRIQAWFTRRSKTAALRRSAEMEDQYNRVLQFKRNPSELQIYLLSVVIRTTFIGAFLGLIAGGFFLYSQLADLSPYLYGRLTSQLLLVIGQAFAVMGSLFIFTICREAISVSLRLKSFEEFKAATEKKLGRALPSP